VFATLPLRGNSKVSSWGELAGMVKVLGGRKGEVGGKFGLLRHHESRSLSLYGVLFLKKTV